jgi:predicted DsbA family dithiol-disulfide isomerase
VIALDILSDPVCPWCLIGKARLDAALAARPGHPFRRIWQPFQLNPGMPRGGMDRAAYLEAKFGGRREAAAVYARVDAAAAEAGIAIPWDRIRRIPNTLDAHRLIHWAGIEGCQEAVVAALFAAYWQEGRDIGDAEVLAALADGAGMDAAVVRRLLSGDADADEVRRREAHARARGVTAVPTFVIADRHVVPGAQPTDLWLRLIDEVSGRTLH